MIRDIEINFATASTYYKRFQAETKNNLAYARLFFFLSPSSSSDTNLLFFVKFGNSLPGNIIERGIKSDTFFDEEFVEADDDKYNDC